jgi:hypothetical protein
VDLAVNGISLGWHGNAVLLHPEIREKASGFASRAMWSSTALTNFGSLPSGKKALAMSTNSVITTLGGVALPHLGPRGAEQGAQHRVDPVDRPFRHQRAVGHLVDPACQFTAWSTSLRKWSTSPSAISSPSS